MVAAQAAFNILDILKIVKPAVDFTAQVTGDKTWQAISGGLQIAGAVTTPKSGGGQTSVGDTAAKTPTPKTPSPKPVAPKGDPGGIKKGISPGGIKKGIGPAPDAQSKELLKVKSTIPKASNPNDQANITKGYLEGLKQSGAKLDNKGQIVKQSGQAFKKPGWDRKAQLMGGRRTPDRLHRLRLLAIDKAAEAKGVKAATTEIVSNIPQTKDVANVKRIWSLDSKSEEELNEIGKWWGLSDYGRWK